MNLQFLIDTNILSEPRKKNPNAAVLEKLKQHDGVIATASVVWHEIWFGCQRLPQSRRRQEIEHYLSNIVQPTMPILAYDTKSARWHADERVRLSSIGQSPPFVDGQIAAIAFTNDLILVTRNITDFENFSGLHLENWYDDLT
jgi:tRNA(fMet)-specific endonuclease VapC